MGSNNDCEMHIPMPCNRGTGPTGIILVVWIVFNDFSIGKRVPKSICLSLKINFPFFSYQGENLAFKTCRPFFRVGMSQLLDCRLEAIIFFLPATCRKEHARPPLVVRFAYAPILPMSEIPRNSIFHHLP